MKKICYLFVLCLLFTASSEATAPVLKHPLTLAGEPGEEITITLKMKIKGHTVYWWWLAYPDTKVEDLRAIVSDLTDDPDVRMAYNGTVLMDGFTLADYGIGTGAIISCS
jgi:hypothetical protein